MNHTRATINTKVLSKAIAATAGIAIVSVLFAPSVDAAEPANHSCVGESLSALTGGPGFGQAIVFFAQGGGPVDTRPGLGDGMQRLQAGAVPDQVVLNTCNNP